MFNSSREAARHMSTQGNGGVIINITSTAGFTGTAPGLSAYVGSKHAVQGMTKQMALEFAPLGIRVLGVVPTKRPVSTTPVSWPGGRRRSPVGKPGRGAISACCPCIRCGPGRAPGGSE
ncbi:SDR family NAD(P)-dependent oxidoreductase [Paenarthrobacter sp. NPDC058040]|uniref:SDR family NAD(P)-dependent oxidoreductase n=1 Tax=unclassified Paenarthrobacter TaxID=2634190 RepID=UPI0036DB0036